MKKLYEFLNRHPDLKFFLTWTGLFVLLFASLVSWSLFKLVAVESNPFFYAAF